ncbi:MAG TPA: anti-sigma factor [Aurantimonas sp.]
MSRDDATITKDDLQAFADGVLDARRRAEVERYFADQPAAAREVADWQQQNQALRALYGHVAGEAVPARLAVHRIAGDRRRPARNWSGMAAAAVLMLAIGGVGGWYGRDVLAVASLAPLSLAGEAKQAHALYATEVLHPVEVRADEKTHLATWLSKRLDRALTVPDLRAIGLALVGGRLLPSQEGPAAQFMYEDSAGGRVTLYIVPADTTRETSFRYAAAGRLKSLVWTAEGISCALVGDLPQDRLQDIAKLAYRQLG